MVPLAKWLSGVHKSPGLIPSPIVSGPLGVQGHPCTPGQPGLHETLFQ